MKNVEKRRYDGNKCRKTVKKTVNIVDKLQKSTQICRKRVKKQSKMLKNCKKPLKNIIEPSNMSKIRGKPSKVT